MREEGKSDALIYSLLIFLSKELGYYLGSCPDEKLVRGLMEFC
jgi:hypothetical protein